MAGHQQNRFTAAISGITLVEWGILAVMGLFLLIAPYYFGLFNGAGLHGGSQNSFEGPFLKGAILTGPLLLLLGAYHFFTRKTSDKAHYLGAFAFLLPLLYVISSFQAASPYLAKIGIIQYLMYFSFLVAGLVLSRFQKAVRIVMYLFLGTGYLFVWISFAFLFGNAFKADALTYDFGVRLTSFFTYANAYAAFLIVMLLAALYRLVTCKGKEAWIHGAMLLPITVSLLMTLSRGAVTMLPFIAIVSLLMFQLRNQLIIAFHFAVSLVLSILLLPDLSQRGTAVYENAQKAIAAGKTVEKIGFFTEASLGGWLRIIGFTAIMVIVTFLFGRFILPAFKKRLDSWSQKTWTRFFIPVLFALLTVGGAVLLFSGILTSYLPTRLSDITWKTHSVMERFYIWYDALKMWKQHPLVGGGGGVWEALYERYQDYPYSSSQTHSYPIQLLIETGVLGLAVFAILAICTLITYMKKYFRGEEREQSADLLFFFIVIVIFLHSVMDFDMSYGYFGAISFFSLGILMGRQSNSVEEKTRAAKAVIKGLSVVCLASAIGLASLSGMYLQAHAKFQDGQRAMESGDFYRSESALKKAANSFHHPVYLTQLIVLYMEAYDQTKDNKWLEQASLQMDQLEKYEPYYRGLVSLESQIATKQGNLEQAAVAYEKGIDHAPFNIGNYKQAMQLRYQLWQQAGRQNDAASLKEQTAKIQALYERAEAQRAKLAKVSDVILTKDRFSITNDLRQFVGVVDFQQGEYAQAIAVLKDGISTSLATQSDRVVARYYLASLRKTGQDDAALYDRLIQSDANEAKELEKLVSAGK